MEWKDLALNIYGKYRSTESKKKNDFKYLITRKGFAFERFYPVIISLSKPDPVELSNMMDGTMTTLDTHFKR